MVTPAWVLDLDGVMWLGDTPIAGSIEAVAELRARGHQVGFCTNNSSRPIDYYVEKLARMGVEDAEVLSSALAAATLIDEGSTVLPCAGEGVVDALRRRGCRVLDRHDDATPADAVVVGFHLDLDYQGLKAATRAVLSGARLIATNSDALYPDGTGWSPGGGMIVAAVERSTGAEAVVAGKPHGPMADLIVERFGSTGVFVGDSLDTDGAMAQRLGWPFELVLTGNTGSDHDGELPPDSRIAADLAAVVSRDLADPTP
jgi:HAD superfamily hydrolase (TIGR01450 family)